jgi:hypothetical protein
MLPQGHTAAQGLRVPTRAQYSGGTGAGLFRSRPTRRRPVAGADMQQGSHGIRAGSAYIGGMDSSRMAGAPKKAKSARRGKDDVKRGGPEWTEGLKQLYDSVVEEPLPDAFRDLLARLDDSNP